MYQKQIKTIKKHLTVKDGQVIATSLDVANFFEKKHKHVLRDIQHLDVPAELRQSNFGLSSYTSEQNKELPMYEMTLKGFVLLAMGFTGKQAMKFKVAYIEAFDQMEKALRERRVSLPAGDFAADDRPVAVAHWSGTARVNHAALMLFLDTFYGRDAAAREKLFYALGRSNKYLANLRAELLKANPLWGDILACRRQGFSKDATARICGCKPATLHKHLLRMAECGLVAEGVQP